MLIHVERVKKFLKKKERKGLYSIWCFTCLNLLLVSWELLSGCLHPGTDQTALGTAQEGWPAQWNVWNLPHSFLTYSTTPMTHKQFLLSNIMTSVSYQEIIWHLFFSSRGSLKLQYTLYNWLIYCRFLKRPFTLLM